MQLLEATETRVERRVAASAAIAAPARARRIVTVAILLVPAVLVVWMGWRHRWTADDGFINLRIVRHIVDGHGPVFNTGQRVEVGTSPLWLAVLSALDLVMPFRLEWIAAITALLATG
ncbi:MAG TPA: hypothetical protein VFW97_01260, partial [Acidimicrobiia bacterium]|nr:hypothetical protein [Acidimicrobiia bacterium]